MTLKEMGIVDSIGLPKFGERQAQAMVNMVKRQRLLESEPPPCEGRGIVIAGGGKYLSHAWVCVKNLRAKGCQLPIQVWFLGDKEMPGWAKPMFSSMGAETVNVYEVMKKYPVRQMSPWISKNYAIAHCPWKQVIFCDADSFASHNPELLMDQIDGIGGWFTSDVANHAKTHWAYVHCGLLPTEKEWEAGQYYVDKHAGWMGLRWSLWLAEHVDIWGKLVHGDKGWTELGFRVSQVPIIVSTECEWKGWGISQQWKGQEWWKHCMGAKRNEVPWPDEIGVLFREWRANTLGKI